MAQFVASFLLPVSLVALLALAGAFLAWRGRGRAGALVVLAAVVLLLGFGFRPVAGWLIAPLERAYPPVTEPERLAGIEYVMVLGAGHDPEPGLPVTGRLPATATARLVEGIRLQRALPGSRLVLSGGGEPVPSARTSAAVARALGVEEAEMIRLPGTANTRDEARRAAAELEDRRLVLVTSASHMPRAMALFRGAGLDPVAAPTRYHAPAQVDPWQPQYLRPQARGLYASERALYEYLGLAWAWLRGQLD
ncbi:ElyC/SanA/YdcF family protein [Thiohalospira sp.]|uniref:ElyC/SanA/YdcF family protein n=1 Tax=Thiohalospira sp. TaxID=3080549 RepID=UPI00397F1314